LEAVLFGKILTDEERKAIVWDIERGVPSVSLPYAWQTDTCIGGWHYDRNLYQHNGYKSPKTVIHMLADIVSKNGNLLLNVPVRGDGSIDEKEEAVLNGIAAWMDVNKESILDTRPWTVFGEGPASEGAQLSAQGFNEGRGKPFTAEDVRYTQKGNSLYAIVLGVPTKPLHLQSLASGKMANKPISSISLLGSSESVHWKQTDASLDIEPPQSSPNQIALAYKVDFKASH